MASQRLNLFLEISFLVILAVTFSSEAQLSACDNFLVYYHPFNGMWCCDEPDWVKNPDLLRTCHGPLSETNISRATTFLNGSLYTRALINVEVEFTVVGNLTFADPYTTRVEPTLSILASAIPVFVDGCVVIGPNSKLILVLTCNTNLSGLSIFETNCVVGSFSNITFVTAKNCGSGAVGTLEPVVCPNGVIVYVPTPCPTTPTPTPNPTPSSIQYLSPSNPIPTLVPSTSSQVSPIDSNPSNPPPSSPVPSPLSPTLNPTPLSNPSSTSTPMATVSDTSPSSNPSSSPSLTSTPSSSSSTAPNQSPTFSNVPTLSQNPSTFPPTLIQSPSYSLAPSDQSQSPTLSPSSSTSPNQNENPSIFSTSTLSSSVNSVVPSDQSENPTISNPPSSKSPSPNPLAPYPPRTSPTVPPKPECPTGFLGCDCDLGRCASGEGLECSRGICVPSQVLSAISKTLSGLRSIIILLVFV